MSEQEQNDYRELGETKPVFPRALTVIGILWFGIGSAILTVLVGWCVYLLISDGPVAVSNACNIIYIFVLGIAIQLITSGRKCMQGTIQDTTQLVWSATAFGCICISVTFVVIRSSINFGNGPPIKSWDNFFLGLVMVCVTMMFFVAAVLAFTRNPARKSR